MLVLPNAIFAARSVRVAFCQIVVRKLRVIERVFTLMQVTDCLQCRWGVSMPQRDLSFYGVRFLHERKNDFLDSEFFFLIAKARSARCAPQHTRSREETMMLFQVEFKTIHQRTSPPEADLRSRPTHTTVPTLLSLSLSLHPPPSHHMHRRRQWTPKLRTAAGLTLAI